MLLARSAHATCLLAALWLWAAARIAPAAEPEPKDDEPAGAEFALQGEYVGTLTTPDGNAAVGVQIVALGHGKFLSVSHVGGLPGDGWDRSPRHEGDGELKAGAAEFKRDLYTSTVKDGLMTVNYEGVKVGELKKIDRESVTLGAPPPSGAVVLFDGSTASNFENGKMTEDGLLLPGCTGKQNFGSGRLHLEFREPFMPTARGQGRGNSGVYVQGRYEVQILDSFGEEEVANGCGAIYGLKAPDQNMSYPPGAWQTYDIDFVAGQYDAEGKKMRDPIMTVRQNHVIINRKTELTQASPRPKVPVGPEPGPVFLQDHGNPVRFRNIWFLETPAEKPMDDK